MLFVEFVEGAAPPDLEAFRRAFDEGLQKENRVYREHRASDTAILAPELVSLPTGTVARFMEEVGRGNVQTKFPRILDDPRKARLRAWVRGSGVRVE